MAKMLLSLGFWMTIVLFIALGYAFGSECSGSMNCGGRQTPFASSVSPNRIPNLENDLRASDIVPRTRCTPNATLRTNYLDFQQMANSQAGAPAYAPGLSIAITRRPPRLSLCTGPIEIPRH
jgi:hypothetical protein